MRITVMHNPTAGDEEHSAGDIIAELEGAGYKVTYQSTKKRKFLKALDDAADVVLVAGGDGTVRKVATRIAGRGVPLAILPCGTANNVVKALGAVSGLVELAEGLERARTKRLDIGIARAPFGCAKFIESVGGGIFARMVRSGSRFSDASPHLAGNKIDRALHLLKRELAAVQPRPWELRVDGQNLSGDYLLLEVMNLRLLGPNVLLAAEADPGDGMLDVVAVRPGQRDDLLEYLDARIEGKAAPLALDAVRGRTIEFHVSGELLHADDMPWPYEDQDDNGDDDDDEEDQDSERERRGRLPEASLSEFARIEVAREGVDVLVVPRD